MTKSSTEEAERAVRQTQQIEIEEEEEDLSKEEESSEEEGHHKEDIEEDKTNKLNTDTYTYTTAFAIIETTFNMMDEVDEDLWIGDSGASSHLI